MTPPVFISLIVFSLAMSITPGPNNLLLTSSGLTYGFRRTIPAMIGTLIGVGLLFVIAGAGVGAIVMAHPHSDLVLRVVGASYLIYLAVRLWRAGEPGEVEKKPPLKAIQVAAFQFVNPKAWMMTISAISIYAASAENYQLHASLVTVTFLVISAPCIAVWAGFGAGMKAVLTNPQRRQLFNRAMAGFTLAAALLVFAS